MNVQCTPFENAAGRCRAREFLSSGCAAIALLFSTGTNALAEGKPVAIKLWDQHIHDKKFRQAIFKEFNKANPDIKVEYTSQVGATYTTVVDSSFRTGTPPDIFVTIGLPVSLAKMIEMGWVLPLGDVAPSKEVFDRWVARFPQSRLPFIENANVFGGKIYSWPTGGEMGRIMFFWNTRLFKDAGLTAGGGAAIPETWDDVRRFASKITELGQGKVYGIVHGIKNDGNWGMDVFNSLAVAAGWPSVEVAGSPMNAGFDLRTGHWDYSHPGLRGAIQLWLDMKKDGSIFPGDLSMDDEQSKFKFSQDLAGMIFGGWWVPGGLLAINDSLEFDVVLSPTPERGARKGYHTSTPLAQNSEYVVSSKIKSTEAVWRVIDFMTSDQYQIEWVKAGGGVSVFPEFNKSEYFPHPTVGKVSQMGLTGRKMPPTMPPGALKVQELFDRGKPDYTEIMQGMWIGRLGWEAWDEFEARLEKAFDKALEEAKKYGVNLTRADFTFPDWDPTKDYVMKARK